MNRYFLVACTRLFTPLCRSVRPSVRPSVAVCEAHATYGDRSCLSIRTRPISVHSLRLNGDDQISGTKNDKCKHLSLKMNTLNSRHIFSANYNFPPTINCKAWSQHSSLYFLITIVCQYQIHV